MPAVSDYSPLDRAYGAEGIDLPTLESPIDPKGKPVFSVREIGGTVPENLGNANLLQNVQAAIRKGMGVLQLTMTPPQAFSSGFKSYGQEYREELRSMLKMNEVNFAGVELPTHISSLSGFDSQHGAFNDQRREQNLQQVRDAIRFTADIGGGGSVDVLSWEYDRNFSDADWWKNAKDAKGNPLFRPPEGSAGQEIVQFVNKTTGKIMSVARKSDIQHLPINPDSLDPHMTPKEMAGKTAKITEGEHHGLFDWTWNDFTDLAEKMNKTGQKVTPMDLFIKFTQQIEIEKNENYAHHYEGLANEHRERARMAREAGDEENAKRFDDQALSDEAIARSSYQSAMEAKEISNKLMPIDEYAVKKSTDAYAELGIAAMNESERLKAAGRLEKPVHVGPESGWPTFYGSHVEEFMGLIDKSREQMAKNLMDNNGMSKEEAMAKAKEHIRGTFDTSHLGMFFTHFMPDEADQQKRIDGFNKWYLDEIHKLAKWNSTSNGVSGIQLVNSMSGEHGHMPPTQGIFPVVEAAKILKQEGNFKGFLVSEGHEEDNVQQGRIVIDAWRAFDPNIIGASGGSGYFNPTWNDTHQQYFGRPYSPNFVFGDYAPSQDFKNWTELPFE